MNYEELCGNMLKNTNQLRVTSYKVKCLFKV